MGAIRPCLMMVWATRMGGMLACVCGLFLVTVQLVGSQCQGVVTLSAPRVVTLQGRASITLTTANTTGVCQIAVRVDNVTQELLVTVSSPPDPLGRR
jgi:hypothetical protein